MSYLERFAPKQRELFISLPYRVGLWISESDTSGGDDADLVEKQALEWIITGYAEDFLKSEVVEEIMRHTILSKDKWAAWDSRADILLSDCEKALEEMEGYIRPEDILTFRQSLMDIGKTVAMAYCELDEENMTQADALKMELLFFIDKMKAKFLGKQQPSKKERLNISAQERDALEKLSQILKVTLEGRDFKDDQNNKKPSGAVRKTDKAIQASAKG